MDQNKIIIVPDVHCRDFYKPVLSIKDKPIMFLGDYMDPYSYEGTCDENGICNLEEIIDFAKYNPNVALLCGNHDESWIWSNLRFERTSHRFYNELHRLYRDNIKLFRPCVKLNDVLFTHAGVSNGWIYTMNQRFEETGNSFRLNEDNIEAYIGNEFEKELQRETALGNLWNSTLESPIFCIGYSRWGDAPYGGPFWDDFNDEYKDPEGWNTTQIFSHTQREITGSIGNKGNGYCVDSRAIFEYDFENKTLAPASI